MSNAALDSIRDLLRELGPLSTKEIVAELTARNQLKSKNPAEYVRSAVAYNRSIVAVGKGKARKCVYLPAFIRGATMRVPMPAAPIEGGRIVVSSELLVFLWPGERWADVPPAKLSLENGPTVKLNVDVGFLAFPYHYALQTLPAAFWAWWTERRDAGNDELEIRCEDGEVGRYAGRAVAHADDDAEALQASNDALAAAAAPLATETRAVDWREFARRVVGTGVFHRDVPPDPLTVALFDPPGRFVLEESRIRYREDLSPAILHVLDNRILVPGSENDWVLRMLVSPDEDDLDDEDDELDDVDGADLVESLLESGVVMRASELGSRPAGDAEDAYLTPVRPRLGERAVRITVALEWLPDVWRTVEILESQTLYDLHRAIQRAFEWDDDHLWEFTLSGDRHDHVTRIAMPQGFMNPDYDPPTADEVTLADLELRPGQRLFYLFDFGDNLGHTLRVDGTADSVPARGYPAVVEVHGEAPPQYPMAEDDVWDDEDEIAEGEDDVR